MSDQGARQRARTAAAEDTPEARAALLRDELRQGVADPGLTRWCAYAGGKEERLVVPNCPCWSGSKETRDYHVWKSCGLFGSLRAWLARLPSLAESCSLADVGGVPAGAHWLLVRTGLEVGLAAAFVYAGTLCNCTDGTWGPPHATKADCSRAVLEEDDEVGELAPTSLTHARSVLRAVQAWVACPCEEHLRAWASLYREDTPDWIPNPVAMVRTTVESLPTYFGWQMQAAARLLPPETIRSCALRVGREEQQRGREP